MKHSNYYYYPVSGLSAPDSVPRTDGVTLATAGDTMNES